jgi:hypothetical protein
VTKRNGESNHDTSDGGGGPDEPGARDAAAYAPVTILVDERPDGVHLSYDAMVSLLAPYDSTPATAVASDLDAQVLRLLATAAGSAGVGTTS